MSSSSDQSNTVSTPSDTGNRTPGWNISAPTPPATWIPQATPFWAPTPSPPPRTGPYEVLVGDGLYQRENHARSPVFNPDHLADVAVTIQKNSTRRIRHPTAPRIPVKNWTEEEDIALLSSPTGRLPGKHHTTCHHRLQFLKTEAAERIAKFEDFKYFNKLPLELRLKIWEIAAWEPRMVEIHSSRMSVNFSLSPEGAKLPELVNYFGWDGPHTREGVLFRSQTLNPPLLFTCTESRSVALRRGYTRAHLRNSPFPDTVYFDVLQDTMFISSKNMWRWIMASELTSSERKSAWQHQYPHGDAVENLEVNLRHMALDAGFFLGKPCKNEDGSYAEFPVTKRRPGRRQIQPAAINCTTSFCAGFKRLTSLTLVLSDAFPNPLTESCFKAMRLEVPSYENTKYYKELVAMKGILEVAVTKRIGERGMWNIGHVSGHTPVEDREIKVDIMVVRSFDKK